MLKNNGCIYCSLYKTRTNIVNGEGGDSPDFLFVGEAPGKEEDKLGRPFVGESGKILRWIIRNSGIRNVRLTNIVRCRPTIIKDGKYSNRTPNNDEILACSQHLLNEIDKVKPKIIIPTGRIPLSFFLKRKPESIKITEERRNVFYWNNIPVLPTWHPAYILRGNTGALEEIIDDIKYADIILNKSISKEEIYLISDPKSLRFLFDRIENAEIFFADLETNGYEGEIVGTSFSWKENTGVYVPIKTWNGVSHQNFWNNEEFVIDRLKKIISDKYSSIIWHNAKYDTKVLNIYWNIPLGKCNDTRLLWSCMYDTKMSGEPAFTSLDYLINKFFPYWGKYKSEVQSRFDDSVKDYSKLPLNILWKYGAMDALVGYKLYFHLINILKNDENFIYGFKGK